MTIKEIKAAIGKKCHMHNPSFCWTMPLTGEYIITGYSYEVAYYDGKPRKTVRVQCERIDDSKLRVWVPPEEIVMIQENNAAKELK